MTLWGSVADLPHRVCRRLAETARYLPTLRVAAPTRCLLLGGASRASPAHNLLCLCTIAKRPARLTRRQPGTRSVHPVTSARYARGHRRIRESQLSAKPLGKRPCCDARRRTPSAGRRRARTRPGPSYYDNRMVGLRPLLRGAGPDLVVPDVGARDCSIEEETQVINGDLPLPDGDGDLGDVHSDLGGLVLGHGPTFRREAFGQLEIRSVVAQDHREGRVLVRGNVDWVREPRHPDVELLSALVCLVQRGDVGLCRHDRPGHGPSVRVVYPERRLHAQLDLRGHSKLAELDLGNASFRHLQVRDPYDHANNHSNDHTQKATAHAAKHLQAHGCHTYYQEEAQ